jgi:phosphohistidine phosphatase
MKKIIFVRHGKAEDEIPELSDFERSLTPSGKKISKQMADLFSKKQGSPGLMISSPAFRALETALIFAGQTGTAYDKILLSDSLYYSTDLMKLTLLLRETGDSTDTVTLFGHNPSFTDIPDILSKSGCPNVPKSGVVCLSFDVDKWSDINSKSGKLEYFLKPDNNK